jgi:hypothetical protein
MIEVLMLHKKVALAVHRIMLKGTVKPLCISNVFGACNAIGRLSGKRSITNFRAGNIGLNYGLAKATALGSYARCPITANQRSGALKIIGLLECLKNAWTIKISGTLSMMPRIFTRMAAC